MKQQGLLSPESRPVAALLFFCEPVTVLYCNLYELCNVLAKFQKAHPLVSGLQFEATPHGLFSKQVSKAFIEMERAGFVLLNTEEDTITIKRTHDVFDKFVEEVRPFYLYREEVKVISCNMVRVLHERRT